MLSAAPQSAVLPHIKHNATLKRTRFLQWRVVPPTPSTHTPAPPPSPPSPQSLYCACVLSFLSETYSWWEISHLILSTGAFSVWCHGSWPHHGPGGLSATQGLSCGLSAFYCCCSAHVFCTGVPIEALPHLRSVSSSPSSEDYVSGHKRLENRSLTQNKC